MLSQKPVIGTVQAVGTVGVARIVVLRWAIEFLEPPLSHQLIATMPLADVTASVAMLVQYLGRRRDLRSQDLVVLDAAVGVTVRARQQRGACRGADRLRHNSIPEEDAFLGQRVQARGPHYAVAVRPQDALLVLVGEDEQNVGWLGHGEIMPDALASLKKNVGRKGAHMVSFPASVQQGSGLQSSIAVDALPAFVENFVANLLGRPRASTTDKVAD